MSQPDLLIERYGFFLRMVTAASPLPAFHARTSLFFGVLFLVLGGLIAVLAAGQIRRSITLPSDAEIPRASVLDDQPTSASITPWHIRSEGLPLPGSL